MALDEKAAGGKDHTQRAKARGGWLGQVKGSKRNERECVEIYRDIFCRWQSYYKQERLNSNRIETTKWRYQDQIRPTKCQAVNLRTQNKAARSVEQVHSLGGTTKRCLIRYQFIKQLSWLWPWVRSSSLLISQYT